MTPRHKCILIVDDDDDLRDTTKIILEDEGWEVHEARHGAEALEFLQQHQPPVMLLDWRMPVLDGGGVLTRLGPLREKIRIVLLTASAQVQDLATQHGVRFYLGKPFGVDQLLGAIEEAYRA